MLLHIYKNLFIQMLRRAGYSKKQAKTIYARFIVELKRENYMEQAIDQVERCGMTGDHISGGFIWSDTKQGLRYWSKIDYNLYKKGL